MSYLKWILLIIFSGAFGLVALCEFLPCEIYSDLDSKFDTPERWQKDFADAIIKGSDSLRPHWFNSDIAAAIFSYTIPRGFTTTQVFSQLRRQLPSFQLEGESSGELVLHRSYGSPKGSRFDEWRFLYSPSHSAITALSQTSILPRNSAATNGL
jgi:hypothetical protein